MLKLYVSLFCPLTKLKFKLILQAHQQHFSCYWGIKIKTWDTLAATFVLEFITKPNAQIKGAVITITKLFFYIALVNRVALFMGRTYKLRTNIGIQVRQGARKGATRLEARENIIPC